MLPRTEEQDKKPPATKKLAGAVDRAEAAGPVHIADAVDSALAMIMARRPGPKPTPRPPRIEAAAGGRPQRGAFGIGGRV